MVFHEERRSRWVATVRAWKHSGLTQRAFAEPLASDLEFHLGAGLFLRFPSGVGPELGMRSATDALSWGRDVRYGAVPKSASSASAAVVANSASRAAFHCLGSSSATSFIG